MPDLFDSLPVQCPPRLLTFGNHALIKCGSCNGTGHGEPNGCEDLWPCSWCNGAGEVLRRLPTMESER